MSTYLSTLGRGVQILKFLARQEVPMTAVDIASALELDRLAAYRCLMTLAEEGLAYQGSDTRWSLDPRAALLAPPRLSVLVEFAAPVLARLASELDATTTLTVAQGEHCTAMSVQQPAKQGFHLAYQEGFTHRIDQGAAGLAILAGAEPLPGERSDIAKFRTDGYASTEGELQPNAFGYAAAIQCEGLRASVGTVGLEPMDPSVFLGPLKRAAEELAESYREHPLLRSQ